MFSGLYVYTKEKDRKFIWLKAAMEEASGKYESASESYRQILEDYISQDSDGDYSQIASFCMERLSKCYKSLGDWSRLEQWAAREAEILEEERHSQLKREMTERIIPQQASAYVCFESAECFSLKELSDWGHLDRDNSRNSSWSYIRTVNECSETLTNVALQFYVSSRLPEDDYVARSSFLAAVGRCKVAAAKVMEEGLRNAPSEHMDDAVLLYYCAHELEDYIRDPETSYDVFRLHKFDDLTKELSSSSLTQVR